MFEMTKCVLAMDAVQNTSVVWIQNSIHDTGLEKSSAIMRQVTSWHAILARNVKNACLETTAERRQMKYKQRFWCRKVLKEFVIKY